MKDPFIEVMVGIMVALTILLAMTIYISRIQLP